MMPVEKIPEGEKYDGGYLEFADMGYVREMAALAKEATYTMSATVSRR